ncbi:hypothetical protein ES319_A05G115900v1 [Gossypium barbadense]|uniref:Uncharacterized protein n=1 Tax=Gossypium barbadense TaxID=3634 RepID=A0A2P5XWC3_GOSBA|nr:hypothetical protein ES319_A05G115900v1 [Gossypium barbadense]PPS07651.1 hypothetical protein GOBAR_AA13024 [Gossypium barbadense]
MGSECNQSKPRYDITMSKRTRKANAIANEDLNHSNSTFAGSSISEHRKRDDEQEEEKESENEDRKSLKQLINGDETANTSSLGRRFSEEEEQRLQLVKKQQDYGNGGVKLKGMMSRYAKVLSHLVKVRREPSLGSKKKQLLRLTNIG